MKPKTKKPEPATAPKKQAALALGAVFAPQKREKTREDIHPTRK